MFDSSSSLMAKQSKSTRIARCNCSDAPRSIVFFSIDKGVFLGTSTAQPTDEMFKRGSEYIFPSDVMNSCAALMSSQSARTYFRLPFAPLRSSCSAKAAEMVSSRPCNKIIPQSMCVLVNKSFCCDSVSPLVKIPMRTSLISSVC